MGEHIRTTFVLLCTLSTRHEGIDLHMPLSQIGCTRPPAAIQKARQKLF